MDTQEAPKKPFWKRKVFIYAVGIFFVASIINSALDGSEEQAKQAAVQPEQIEQVAESKSPAPAVEKAKTNTAPSTKTEVKATSATTQAPTPTSAPQTDRASVLAILKANASAEWGSDFQMVQYEYNNQVEAYDWVVAQTKYPAIMVEAKDEWGNDYQMVKYEYGNQVEAYEWVLAQTAYPNIMANAKQKWGTDYQMVKYEYENQVKAYKSL